MEELVSEKPTRGMLVKSPLYGDVSEKPMMGMIYPFSTGTLTFIRTIKRLSRSFATVSFLLVRTIRMSCIIKSPN
jgi:hypothetical protein